MSTTHATEVSVWMHLLSCFMTCILTVPTGLFCSCSPTTTIVSTRFWVIFSHKMTHYTCNNTSPLAIFRCESFGMVIHTWVMCRLGSEWMAIRLSSHIHPPPNMPFSSLYFLPVDTISKVRSAFHTQLLCTHFMTNTGVKTPYLAYLNICWTSGPLTHTQNTHKHI